MKTFLIAIFYALIHLACCLFPFTILGFNLLSFLRFSDSTKNILLWLQVFMLVFIIVRLSMVYCRVIAINKSELLVSWLSLCLIIFSFYINFYEPFHSEKQKMMKLRIERLKNLKIDG